MSNILFKGKSIDKLTKPELIEAIEWQNKYINSLISRQRQYLEILEDFGDFSLPPKATQ